jgi:hypothetical protein
MSNSILYKTGKWRNRSYSLIGGFTDITSLYDCLMAIQNGVMTDESLDKYSEIRSKKRVEIIDPVPWANLGRLWAEDAISKRLVFFEIYPFQAPSNDFYDLHPPFAGSLPK